MTNDANLGMVLVYGLVGLIALTAMLYGFKFFRTYHPNIEKQKTYESGEEPMGDAFTQINSRYYLFAIIFLLFEVEIIFLFPWATISMPAENPEWLQRSLIEMGIFIFLLVLGFAFVWKKGYLEWIKPDPTFDATKNQETLDKYQEINKKYTQKA